MVGKYISFIYWYSAVYRGRELAPLNITSGQFGLIMFLSHHDGISQGDLVEELMVDKGTVARSIQRLIEEGYVEKRRDPQDGRSFQLFITQKGKEIVPRLKEIQQGLENDMLTGFSQEERAALLDMLRRAAGNLKEMKERRG